MPEPPYQVWVCEVCGFTYDEAEGWPDEGIAPGTRFADLPEKWRCPQCRAVKSKFDLTEA